MKIASKVKLALRSILLKGGAISTDKGELLYDTDELEIGIEVYRSVDGEIVPAEDGEYEAEGKTIVVKDGKVDEIREKEVKEEIEVEAEDEDAPAPADEPETVEDETIEQKVARLEESLGEMREGIENITNALAAVVARLEVAEEKIKGLDAPAAEPAEQGEETEVKASMLECLKNNRQKKNRK